MAKDTMAGVVAVARRAGFLHGAGELSDGELLGCFVSEGREAAFEALVRRHGPMVLGVCRRVLHQSADAEDAFQATFLVLLRKAHAIARPEVLGSWLHGVAFRTAARVRAMLAKRRARERAAMERVRPETHDPLWQDLAPVLDQEVNRLPERYRVPVVLCDLEGKSRQEAARHLDVPEGTISSRLARGREMLRRRLARRGVTVGATVLAGLLAQDAVRAAVPPTLLATTVRAAVALSASMAADVSLRVSATVEAVVRGLLLKEWRVGALLLLVGSLFGLATVALRGGQEQPQGSLIAARGSFPFAREEPLRRLPLVEPAENAPEEEVIDDPEGEDPPRITPPPPELKCDPFYRKYISAGGLPVLSSARVSDPALLEAVHVVHGMLANRPDLHEALIAADVRVVVMHPTESVTDIPEKRGLRPKQYWDRRLRSTGGRITACGEENLLGFRGDRFRGQSTLVHELAHSVHLKALRRLDAGFEPALARRFERARAQGLWKGTNAAASAKEYWAEAVQCYFDCNKPRVVRGSADAPVGTREDLRAYDPEMYALVDEVFGAPGWRYRWTERRN